MSWRRVGKSLQEVAAHTLLFCVTLLLVLKLDHIVSYSWWTIFFPLWIFHLVVARGRFSLPAPSVPHNRHWAPCHAVVAMPLLVAFELLLCIYLESVYVSGYGAVNLKIVFLPLLAFEVIVLTDNIRMCKALLPGDDESMSDEAIWETLPHFWVAISMVFFVAATVFTLLKLSGDVGALGWWDLFINYGIAECFAFLVCTKWTNPVIHRHSRTREESSSSTTTRYLDWNNNGITVSSEERSRDRMCGLEDIGGHIIKIPIICFQILLCMRLEGTPPSARNVPLPLLFSPLFLLQGVGVLFATSRLVEKIVVLLRSEAGRGMYFVCSSRIHDLFDFLHHGSRLLGWWSIDETSREEQARLFHEGASGYNTFRGYSPEIVKKMPKKDLAEEVWRLQAALGEQTEITKFSQQEYERLHHVLSKPSRDFGYVRMGNEVSCKVVAAGQAVEGIARQYVVPRNEKILCRICFEGEISIVLLPCRHRILCSTCSEKCKNCPICRVSIEDRLPVYDV